MEAFIKLAHEQLEQRKHDLRNEMLDSFGTKQNTLLDKQNEIQGTIKLITDNIIQAENTTKTGDVSKLKPICDSLKEVNEKIQSTLYDLDLGEDYLNFDSNKAFNEFTEWLCALGQPHYRGFLPTMIRLQALEVKAGLKAALKLDVLNHHGDKVPVPSDSFSVQITDPTDTEIHTQLCTTGPDCSVTFTPKVSGLHQVSGFFLGQKLIGEQTHISVSGTNPVLKFGRYGQGKGTFHLPWGITIDNNDIIYVVDTCNRLIQKFSLNGEFLSQFGVNSHDKDCTAVNMALDVNNGLLYCTDVVFKNNIFCAGSKLLVFNLNGELQRICNLSDISFPLAVSVNSHGDLFIADKGKKCLVKVDKQGNKLQCMGDFGYPADIAITEDDSIIVSDAANNCIHVLNPDGSNKHKFGSSGSGEGQLKKPWGVVADGDKILVADNGNKRIQIFKFDGSLLSVIGSEDDPLHDPRGLVVTKDGFVYVTDAGSHSIKKFRYTNIDSDSDSLLYRF